MTKCRRLWCNLDEPSACYVVLCRKNSQKAGLQKPDPRNLDREMQNLEVNKRAKPAKIGMNKVDGDSNGNLQSQTTSTFKRNQRKEKIISE